jgi:hypothetical protein
MIYFESKATRAKRVAQFRLLAELTIEHEERLAMMQEFSQRTLSILLRLLPATPEKNRDAALISTFLETLEAVTRDAPERSAKLRQFFEIEK